MTVLSSEDVQRRLASVPGWSLSDAGALEREWKLADFAAAIAFVGRVAQVAEEHNHHPDILVHGWNRVHLTLSTHSEGGLTESDFKLAGLLDQLA